MRALFDIVNAASRISQRDCCSATLTRHRRNQNHMQIRHDATRFIVDLRMALLNAPCTPLRDRACTELVPSFYRMQNPLSRSNGTKAFSVNSLICFYWPQKGRMP
jgi:hypothetical protein